MAIYDNLPYTNFHELNADWLLKQMKEAKAKVDSIQEEINQFNEDYAALAAVFTVSGNNVSIPGTMTANGFSGNLTGNVTGNVTGNLTGNVTGDVTGDLTGDVTGGSFQGSYVEATNGQITHDLTVGNDAEIFNNLTVDGTIFGNLTGDVSGNAATATTATNATNATVLDGNNELTGDPNEMYEQGKLKMYYGPGFTSHYPTNCGSEPFLLLTADRGLWRLQIAIFPMASIELYFRIFTNNNWGTWYSVDKTQAQS